MVKKISVIMLIFSVIFFTIPINKVGANSYDYISGLYIPNYIMEAGGSSNIYEPKFHEPGSFNNITLQQYIENMKNGSHTGEIIPINYMYILSVNVNPDDLLQVTFILDGQQQQMFDGINLIVLKKLENSVSIRFYEDYNSTEFASFNSLNNSNDVFGLQYIFDVGPSLDYQKGYNDGYEYGLDEGWYIGYDDGFDDGEDEGFDNGYYEGLNEQDATGFVGLLTSVFGGLGTLLSIELLPNIHIGAIIAVPLVFGIIFFILGKRKGD